MYHHLLVPLDETELSAANTADALRLAAKLGARVTFMYAAPDYGASSEGALDHTIDPAGFAERASGQTHSILAKAGAAAGAAGVPFDSCARVNDRPAEAIIEAAKREHCDLIVMASRGATGVRALLSRSQTRKVLEHTPVALLVTRVGDNDPQANAVKAVAIIQDEHRSMAVVIRGMVHLAEDARAGAGFDRDSLQRMLQYLYAFPIQCHHPKEEQSLHRLLRLRSGISHALINALEAEHQKEYRLVAEVSQALAACPADVVPNDPRLANLIGRLAAMAQAVWAHLGKEEAELLPLARAVLTAADWDEVAQSFEANRDPRFGELSDEDFRRLFTSIANLMAKPQGAHIA